MGGKIMAGRAAAQERIRCRKAMQRVLTPSGIIQRAGRPADRQKRFSGRLRPLPKTCRASFTIEAAIVAPLVLAVIFLLLQTTLYLHDCVQTSAWLYERAWSVRWSAEGGGEPEGIACNEAPRTPVLRYVEGGTSSQGNTCRAEAGFEICLLPPFVAAIFTGQPQAVRRQVTEKTMDTPAFLQIAGAILEEIRE